MSDASPAESKVRPTGDIRLYLFPGVAFAGAIMIVIGSLGPWAKVVGEAMALSYSGTDTDGKYTLFLGIGLAIAILVSVPHPRLGYSLAIPGSLIVLVLAIRSWGDVSEIDAALRSYADTSVAWGLWLVVIGAGLVLGGIIVHLAYNPEAVIYHEMLDRS